jgi:Flp pilus assembly protein TadD
MTTWKTLQASAADHLTRGDLGKAAHALVEAIELEPTEPRLYEQLIRVTLLGGSTQTAVSAAEELARLSPGPHASHLHVVSLLAHGDVATAKQVLDAAFALAPDSVELLQASAQVATIEGRPAEALKLLGDAAAWAPRDAVVVNDYALALLAARRSAEAKALLEPLSAEHPNNLALRLTLSMVALTLRDLPAARAHALAAKSSDDPEIRTQAIALVNQLTR